jgi:DNA-binding MarR family transcriptional regulator
MGVTTESREERLLALLSRLRRLGLHEAPFERALVTPTQLALLECIIRSPGCSLQDIVAHQQLSAPTVSVVVRRLEDALLVQRQPHPHDGRAIQLFLTDEGRALVEQAQDFRCQKVRKLLGGLSASEQEHLFALLDRALSAAESAGSLV